MVHTTLASGVTSLNNLMIKFHFYIGCLLRRSLLTPVAFFYFFSGCNCFSSRPLNRDGPSLTFPPSIYANSQIIIIVFKFRSLCLKIHLGLTCNSTIKADKAPLHINVQTNKRKCCRNLNMILVNSEETFKNPKCLHGSPLQSCIKKE